MADDAGHKVWEPGRYYDLLSHLRATPIAADPFWGPLWRRVWAKVCHLIVS